MMPRLRNSTVTVTWITTHSERKIWNLISPISGSSCQRLLLLLVPEDVIDVENWSNTSSMCPCSVLASCSRIRFLLVQLRAPLEAPFPLRPYNSHQSTNWLSVQTTATYQKCSNTIPLQKQASITSDFEKFSLILCKFTHTSPHPKPIVTLCSTPNPRILRTQFKNHHLIFGRDR